MKPRSIHSVARFALGAVSAGILAACGGGGGGGSDIADGGIRGTGSSVGPVSGFGSVFVNGVRFEIQGANNPVQSNDGISAQSELDEGMILRVDGEWRENGEGMAERVDYDDTLRGPIKVETPWDPDTRRAIISVLGLEVVIDRQTVIKGVGLPGDLALDDVVRVSGWRLADGSFRASLVRVHSGSGDAFDMDNGVELEGRVTNYVSSPCSFEIGTARVLCHDQNITLEGLDLSDFGDDDLFVEVEGNLNSNDDVMAAEIRQDDIRRYRRGTADDIEFAGTVTAEFNSATQTFGLNGITVNVLTPETEFEDDLSPQDLVPGLLVQVEGDYLSDGTVNADEIELREANAKVEGAIGVSSINQQEKTFTVGGVRVRVTPLTLIKNDDDDDSTLTRDQLFAALAFGGELEIEGIERGTDANIFLEALKIEREGDEGETEFELEGKLRDVTGNSITVLGIEIQVNFAALGCTSAQLQALIDERNDGSFPTVEVEYEPTDSSEFTYVATEIESEDDNGPDIECDD